MQSRSKLRRATAWVSDKPCFSLSPTFPKLAPCEIHRGRLCFGEQMVDGSNFNIRVVCEVGSHSGFHDFRMDKAS